jgi:lipopolysaccharide export system protein LptA
MILKMFAVLAAVSTSLAVAHAQPIPGQGPLEISAEDFEGLDAEGRIVYVGDANAVRGDTRLRADRIEAYLARREGGGFGNIERVVAIGEVYYVTPTEVARGDRGVYDLVAERIELTGAVVLTQGCNVSTGETLVVDLAAGSARLSGGDGDGGDGRVRSLFFDQPDDEAAPRDCPQPVIPGRGPQPFPDENG